MGKLGSEHWTCRAARNELAPGELIAGSSPTEHPGWYPGAIIERKHQCGRYNRCNDFATRAKWKSWECTTCDVVDPMSIEQAAMDQERIPLLVLKAFAPRKRGAEQCDAGALPYRVNRGGRNPEAAHIDWSAVPFGEATVVALARMLGVSTTTVARHKRLERMKREIAGSEHKP